MDHSDNFSIYLNFFLNKIPKIFPSIKIVNSLYKIFLLKNILLKKFFYLKLL